MKTSENQNITRIGVFYDGNYFLHVSNYYNYVHERRARISVKGLHQYIRHKVAEFEGQTSGARHSQIVDSHYFKGRLNAREASEKGNKLYFDRVFDDVLMMEGITTHYLPLRGFGQNKQEKGIDVWLALEAFELASYQRFDVLALVASDGDYVPLIRKLNMLGTRVMLLSWDFEFTDDYGNERVTRTSQDLLEGVTYPVAMHDEIENRVAKDSYLINELFIKPQPRPEYSYNDDTDNQKVDDSDFDASEEQESEILSLKNGFGFIKWPNNNLFFHHMSLRDTDFNDLREGDTVSFHLSKNDRGELIAVDVELAEQLAGEMEEQDYDE